MVPACRAAAASPDAALRLHMAAEALRAPYWPDWPPKPAQLAAPERLATALRYCKPKRVCAFLSLDPAAVPPCTQKPPFA